MALVRPIAASPAGPLPLAATTLCLDGTLPIVKEVREASWLLLQFEIHGGLRPESLLKREENRQA